MRRIACLGIVLSFLCPLTWADSILSFGSPSAPVTLGSSFSVPIQISGVTNLYGYAFDVSYNPSVLQLTSITEGSFLSSAGLTDFQPGIIDNSAGVAVFTSSIVLEPNGASGSGTLADFTFRANGAGSSDLSFLNFVLLDPSFATIPSTTGSNPTVVAVAVPEPDAYFLALFSFGVLGVCIVRRLRHPIRF